MRELLVDPAVRNAALRSDTGLRHLPRFWVGVWEALWGAPYDPADAEAAAATAHFRGRQIAMTAGLHAEGAAVHAGTDTLMPYVAPGSSLHGELADLRASGIPRDDVWRIATSDAGRFLGEAGLGALAVAAPADLVFLKAPPAGDEAFWSHDDIAAVLADGRLYRRADLDDALARSDAHFHGPLYDGVMAGVVRVVRGTFAP